MYKKLFTIKILEKLCVLYFSLLLFIVVFKAMSQKTFLTQKKNFLFILLNFILNNISYVPCIKPNPRLARQTQY